MKKHLNTKENIHAKLKIIFVKNEITFDNVFRDLRAILETYFWIEIEEINQDQILSITNKKIDFLFVDWKKEFEEILDWDMYHKLHSLNPNFTFVWLKNSFDSSSYYLLKNGADDILNYGESIQYFKWKAVSIIRRRWDKFSTDNTIIFRGLIIDFIRQTVSLNSRPIDLTAKEFAVLSFLLKHARYEFVNKVFIYREIWQTEDEDFSRSLDQILYKLRLKIGSDYFSNTKRGKVKMKDDEIKDIDKEQI